MSQLHPRLVFLALLSVATVVTALSAPARARDRGPGDPLISPDYNCCMGFAYDSALDRFFVYGGKDNNNLAMDKTWKWDPTNSQWTPLSAVTGIAHSSTRMVYHPFLEAPTGRLVVYGGNGDQDSWFFDGSDSGTWNKCVKCRDPNLGARASEGMAFYPANTQNRVVVLFGGDAGAGEDFTAPTLPLDDTWILTGSTEAAADWVQCTTPCATHPSPRSSPGIAYYKVTNKAILFGGIDTSSRKGDTWRYDQLAPSSRWVQCTGTGCTPVNTDDCASLTLPPCIRYGHRMAFYDTASNKSILMFGGSHSNDTVVGDTWLFTGNPGGWVPCDPAVCLSPPFGPEGRCCYGLTFDSVRNKVYLFGGSVPPQIGNHRYKDLWTWTATGGWHCESPNWCNLES